MAIGECFIIAYSQSIGVGPGTAPNKITPNGAVGVPVNPTTPKPNVRQQTLWGQPSNGLIALGTPGAVNTSSMFTMMKSLVAARTGKNIMLINCARGNTGVVDAWVGRDSTTGELCKPGDAGYDASEWIKKAANCVAYATGLGYRVTMITEGFQNDVAANRSLEQIVAAAVHVQERFKAAGASRVVVGKTARYIGGSKEAEWNPGGLIHRIADGILAAIPGSFPGADLTTNTDSSLHALDEMPFIHPNHAGICVYAEKWANAIIDNKLI